ncbi:MAG: SPOR domain-containing protein [Stenotrophobium sp.]
MDDQLKRRLVGVGALLAVALLFSLLLPPAGKPPADDDGVKHVTLDLRQPATAMPMTQAVQPATPMPPVIAAVPPPAAASTTADSDDAPQFEQPPSSAADNIGNNGDNASTLKAAQAPTPKNTEIAKHSVVAAVAAPIQSEHSTIKPPPQDRADAAVKSATGRGAWFVQAGTFSDVDNARRLASKLRDGGYRVVVAPVETHAGVGYRVRSGPYGSRELALGAQKSLMRLGIDHAEVVGE